MDDMQVKAEPILGWRVWTYTDWGINWKNKPRLYSIGRTGGLCGPIEYEWPIGKPMMADMHYSFGIHAWKSPLRAAFDTTHLPGRHFWGGVWLWGEVAEHNWGYRGEYAYPACLCGVLSFLFGRAEEIAAEYGIPVYFGFVLDQHRLERRVREDWKGKLKNPSRFNLAQGGDRYA